MFLNIGTKSRQLSNEGLKAVEIPSWKRKWKSHHPITIFYIKNYQNNAWSSMFRNMEKSPYIWYFVEIHRACVVTSISSLHLFFPSTIGISLRYSSLTYFLLESLFRKTAVELKEKEKEHTWSNYHRLHTNAADSRADTWRYSSLSDLFHWWQNILVLFSLGLTCVGAKLLVDIPIHNRNTEFRAA